MLLKHGKSNEVEWCVHFKLHELAAPRGFHVRPLLIRPQHDSAGCRTGVRPEVSRQAEFGEQASELEGIPLLHEICGTPRRQPSVDEGQKPGALWCVCIEKKPDDLEFRAPDTWNLDSLADLRK